MEFLNSFKVAMLGDEIVILKLNLLGSQVMRADGSTWLSSELAPISEFVIIGDFFPEQEEVV